MLAVLQTVGTVLLWILGIAVGLVVLVLLLLLLLCCLPIGARIAKDDAGTSVWLKIGLIRYLISSPEKTAKKQAAKAAKKEPTEKQKAKQEKKKAKKEEKKKIKRQKKREKLEARLRAAQEREKAGLPPKKAKKSAKRLKPPKQKDLFGLIRAICATLADYDYEYLKLICIRRLRLDWIVGGGDPAGTGRAYGRAAAIFGDVYPVAMRKLNIKRHQIFVNPDFVHNQSKLCFDVTVTITLIRCAYAAFVFWKGLRRNRRIYCKQTTTTKETTVSGRAA